MASFPLPFGGGAARNPFSVPASITEAEYQFIRETVYQHSRINLGPSKKELVMARLSKRLRALNLASYADYIALLRSPAGKDEMTNLIDSISTNHTYFFREPQHFEFLSQVVLPGICEAPPPGFGLRTFKVWSAATSTGEEPYSIATLLADYFSRVRGWNWKILCTDISTRVLRKAGDGIFAKDRVDQVRPDWLARYFEKGHGQSEGFYRARPELRQNMQFVALNLLGPSYPFNDIFQVIFCRNVMIYFDRQTQQELVLRLEKHLAPGGYLMIGHAESLTAIQHNLKLIKPSIYRKPE